MGRLPLFMGPILGFDHTPVISVHICWDAMWLYTVVEKAKDEGIQSPGLISRACALTFLWECEKSNPMKILKSMTTRFRILRNYFCIDMDPLHPMSFWRLLASLDMDIYPQNRCDGFPV